MMSKKYAVVSLMLALVMVLALLAGCGETETSTEEPPTTTEDGQTDGEKEEEGSPFAEQKHYDINLFVGFQVNTPPADTPVEQKLEEYFNVTFNVTGTGPDTSAQTQYMTQLRARFAAGDYPDLFYCNTADGLQDATAAFTMEEARTYMPKLSQRIDEVGPPMAWELNSYQDKLRTFPRLWVQAGVRGGLLWRDDWGKEVGYTEPPKTLQEVEDYFRKIKVNHPDAYGMSLHAKEWYKASWVFGAYGAVQTHWTVRNNHLVHGGTLPEMKDALKLLSEWYKAGYIDPDFLNQAESDASNLFAQGKLAMTTGGWRSLLDADVPNTFAYNFKQYNPTGSLDMMPYPVGPTGEYGRYKEKPFGQGMVAGAVGFGKHLEEEPDKLHRVMQIVEGIATNEDLFILTNFGIEGVHWDYGSHGLPKMKPEYQTADAKLQQGIAPNLWSPFHANATEFWDKYFLPGGALTPIPEDQEKVAEANSWYEKTVKTYNDRYYNVLNDRVPLAKQATVNEAIAALGANPVNLNAYYQGVITGERSLDEFDKVVADWKAAGGDEQARIYELAIDMPSLISEFNELIVNTRK